MPERTREVAGTREARLQCDDCERCVFLLKQFNGALDAARIDELERCLAGAASEPLAQPTAVIVWRKELTSCFRTLDAAEAEALEHAITGATFGALCSMLVQARGDVAGVKLASELLAQWLRDGLIVAVTTASSP